ncbi:MAG: DUF6769 family protein [Bacteroidales bacterium]
MKRHFCILLLTVATISYIAVTVIAHHHHGGSICMAIELCENEGNVNDNHAHHHGDVHNNTNEEDCCPLIVKDCMTISKSVFCSGVYDMFSFVGISVTAIIYFSDNDVLLAYNSYVPPFYKSPQSYSAVALRAPPSQKLV